MCIVGPSGCGKTTLLRSLSGLMSAEGSVLLAGERVTRPPAQMALVFQDRRASLMSWLSVVDNIKLPLINKRLDRAEIHEPAQGSLDAVALGDFATHYPWPLSGGMRQRVAIARALAYRLEILPMDEPFASVDAQTRADLENLPLEIHARSAYQAEELLSRAKVEAYVWGMTTAALKVRAGRSPPLMPSLRLTVFTRGDR